MNVEIGHNADGSIYVEDSGYRDCESCGQAFDETGGTDEVRGELLCWSCIDTLAREGDERAIAAGGEAS